MIGEGSGDLGKFIFTTNSRLLRHTESENKHDYKRLLVTQIKSNDTDVRILIMQSVHVDDGDVKGTA